MDFIYKREMKIFSDAIEMALKVFSLLSFFGLIFGGVLIWRYLAIIGISGEIIPALSSPQTLIALSVWAAILSTLIVLMIFVAPFQYKHILKSDGRWKGINKTCFLLVHSAAFFAPPGIFLYLSAKGLSASIFFWSYAVITTLETAFLFCFYSGKGAAKRKLTTADQSLLLLIFMALAFAIISTLFVILIIAPTLVNLYGSGDASMYAAYMFFILYAICMAFSVSYEKKRAHLPMAMLSALTVIVCLMTDAPKNAARKVNIGWFNANITVDEKGYAALSMIEGLNIRQTSSQTYLVKDVFVLLDLPNKLILSASSDSQEKVSLSTSSVIGSVQLKNPREK